MIGWKVLGEARLSRLKKWRESSSESLLDMKTRVAISILAAAVLVVGASGAPQPGITLQTLRGYLEKMGLRYVPHPKNPDALVVPRSENQHADRLDLYVEIRQDHTLILTVYPRLNGRYFTLARSADREKMFQRLLEANHRAFAAFFVDGQGDIGARFTFTTETGVPYDSFRVAVTELLRIADEYTPILNEYMRKEESERKK
jgi:Putative bacterial sensory transduction regulator